MISLLLTWLCVRIPRWWDRQLAARDVDYKLAARLRGER